MIYSTKQQSRNLIIIWVNKIVARRYQGQVPPLKIVMKSISFKENNNIKLFFKNIMSLKS